MAPVRARERPDGAPLATLIHARRPSPIAPSAAREWTIGGVDASDRHGHRSYTRSMATPAENTPNDPALVVIDRPSEASFDDWLAELEDDEPSAVDADAAEALRQIREHGER